MKTSSRGHRAIIAASLLAVVLSGIARAAPVQGDIEASRSYRTVASIDGWIYSSKIPKDAVLKTGAGPGWAQIQPGGIGLVAAGEKADQAFRELNLPDAPAWVLHSLTRKLYTGVGWVYEAAFTKKSEKLPDYMGNQLAITVLVDGTVIPVERRKNGN